MALPLRQYYALLKEYLKPYRGMVALLGVLIAGLSLLELVIPQVIGRFIQGTQTDAVAPSLRTLLLSSASALAVPSRPSIRR